MVLPFEAWSLRSASEVSPKHEKEFVSASLRIAGSSLGLGDWFTRKPPGDTYVQ